MRLFLARHARPALRASAILVIASSLIGVSLALAEAPASRMGRLPMERRAATLPIAGTAVRLPQHLVRVSIDNFAFKPARLVVSPGTRIVWTNKDSDPHTVTSAKGLWPSDALDTDEHLWGVGNGGQHAGAGTGQALQLCHSAQRAYPPDHQQDRGQHRHAHRRFDGLSVASARTGRPRATGAAGG